MRILYLSDADFASKAANAVQISRMCESLAALDHEVHVTGVRSSKPVSRGHLIAADPGQRISTHLLPWPWRRFRWRLLIAQAKVLCFRLRPNLVVCRSPLLARATTSSGWPVVLELHSLPDRASHASRALDALVIDPLLVKLVCISQGLADDLKARYAKPGLEKTIVVLHDAASPGPEPVPEPPSHAGVRAGYFGHLYPGKGMEMLARLAPEVPEVQFCIYGGMDDDLERWKAATSSLTNLTFYGHIVHDDVRRKMEECNLLLAPYGNAVQQVGGGDISRWMSPLKVFEYMAARRAILASDLPVIRETLSNGETALLVRPDDVAAWSSAIRRLIADATLRDRLASQAREQLVANHSWKRRAEKLVEGLSVSHGHAHSS